MRNPRRIPLVVEFDDLTDEQRRLLIEHPDVSSHPIRTRRGSRGWIVAFESSSLGRDELYATVERWARSSGLPTARRVS